MSDLTNKDLQFRLKAPLVVYSAEYTDANQNVWRIDCTGLPELAEQFVEQRGLLVNAEAISRERASALAEALRVGRSPMHERVAALIPTAVATHPIESTSKPEAASSQGQEPSGVIDLEYVSPEAPALSVDVVMLKAATEGPQHITFVIDPIVTQPNPIFRASFTVAKGDNAANVTCAASDGQVGMWLESPIAVRAVGGSAKAFAAEGSVWGVKVQWLNGAPAVFSLSGDIVVM